MSDVGTLQDQVEDLMAELAAERARTEAWRKAAEAYRAGEVGIGDRRYDEAVRADG